MFYNEAKILVLRALSGLNYILADFSNAATQQGGVAASDGRAPRLACGLSKSPVDGIVSLCMSGFEADPRVDIRNGYPKAVPSSIFQLFLDSWKLQQRGSKSWYDVGLVDAFVFSWCSRIGLNSFLKQCFNGIEARAGLEDG